MVQCLLNESPKPILENLSDSEVIQLLFGVEDRSTHCSDDGRIYQTQSLHDLVGTDIFAFENEFKLTPLQSRCLAAAFELHRRLLLARQPRCPLTTPELVASMMIPYVQLDHERLWCLALDSHSALIGYPIQIYQGDIDSCDARPRSFLRNALMRGAVKTIMVHNHPAGDPTPSSADVAVTKNVIAAAKAVEIDLVDHVVITATGAFTSMRRDRCELWR